MIKLIAWVKRNNRKECVRVSVIEYPYPIKKAKDDFRAKLSNAKVKYDGIDAIKDLGISTLGLR